jgi:hypothetical protein
MYYCDPCRTKNKWPEGFMKSVGPCEVCGKVRMCNDVRSSDLPDREATPAEMVEDINTALDKAVGRVIKLTGYYMQNKDIIKADKYRRLQRILRNVQKDLDELSS